jgi:5-methylcytosine-specific restriction enzyme A
MIKELFEKILDTYHAETKTPLSATNPLAATLRDDLPSAIFDIAKLTNGFLVKGSPGQIPLNWAEVPWICVFDREITTSAQQGYYIVYLFDAQMEGVYLSLNQGWTQYHKQFGVNAGRAAIQETARGCQRLLRTTLRDFSFVPINLHARNTLGRGYEFGHICGKFYAAKQVADDAVLVNDLRNLIGVYRELKGLVGTDILDLKHLLEKADEVDEEPKPEETINVNKQVATAKTAEEIDTILTAIENANRGKEPAVRRRVASAIARNTKIAKLIKERYHYRCTICGTIGFEKRDGSRYAEVHHIEELGNSGLDVPSNIICVCPTCHRVIHYGSEGELNYRRLNREQT